MPGVTVVRNSEDNIVDDALRSVCFNDRYSRHYITNTEDRHVAYTGYDEYPIETFETGDHTVVLEGYLYGTSNVERAVTDAAKMVSKGETSDLSKWVANRDGDFLLVVIDQSDGMVWAINDAFGRLPTFRATIAGTTVVTRELKLVRTLARTLGEELEPDTLGLGQTLLFGYPLGTRTIYEGVEQLPPGSVLTVGSDATAVESIHEFQFDSYPNANRTVEGNARRLRDRFIEACENRAAVAGETVISLSGGLDSRASIAGFTHADGTLLAATSARKDGSNTTEVNVARQVANELDIPWRSYLTSRTDDNRDRLLEITQGMNNLSMSLGLDFAKQVAEDHHDAIFITGNGGKVAKNPMTPSKEIDSLDELVEALIDSQHVFSLEDVTELIDIDPERLISSVRERLDSYPESTVDGKHIKFILRERGTNWHNHGEDRTRNYLWSTTPFYSLPFFTEALACPPDQKRGTDLYREFLSLLSPVTVEIDYADFGAPIDSWEYRVKRFGYDWLSERPALKNRVLNVLDPRSGQNGNGVGDSPPVPLMEAASDPSALESTFASDTVQRITWSGGYATSQQYLLLTLISAFNRESTEPKRKSATTVEPRLTIAQR